MNSVLGVHGAQAESPSTGSNLLTLELLPLPDPFIGIPALPGMQFSLPFVKWREAVLAQYVIKRMAL